MLNFKEKLIRLRKDNNLTQDELAKKLKISRSAVANYEKGIREHSTPRKHCHQSDRYTFRTICCPSHAL